MLSETLATFLGSQKSRPLSVAVAVASLLLPGSLLLFIAKPALVSSIGVVPTLLLSAAFSLPILLICFGLWYSPLRALRQAQQKLTEGPQRPDEDIGVLISQEDPLEWPSLLAGSWLATGVLYVVAAVAYFRPIRIGATMVLVALLLVALWLVIVGWTSFMLSDEDHSEDEAPET